jgi:hypothetical protein
MFNHVTVGTLKQICELAQASAAAEWVADPDNRVWGDFGEPYEPRPRTPEWLALHDFLEGLSHDELVETQAAHWWGRDFVPKERAKRALQSMLDYSRKHPDDMVLYLIGNDLARALSRAVRLLEENPGLVKETAR